MINRSLKDFFINEAGLPVLDNKIDEIIDEHLELIIDEVMHLWQEYYEENVDDDIALQQTGEEAWEQQVQQAASALAQLLKPTNRTSRNVALQIATLIDQIEQRLHQGEFNK